MTRRCLPGLVLFALLGAAAPAVAAPPPPAPGKAAPAKGKPSDASARAQALFDSGVADMEAEHFEKACPAIEASQRMEPMPGTLFTLAECEAQRGRTATAMRYYAEYLTLYRAFSAKKKQEQGDRATTSEAQIEKLSRSTPRLTLVRPSGVGEGVIVKRDGEVVPDLSLGVAVPVDPGEHVITTQVPGGPEVEMRVLLEKGVSKVVELPVKRSSDVAPPRLPEPDKVAPPPEPADVTPWQIGGVSAIAVGLIGVGVGIATGVMAKDASDEFLKNCGPNDACTPGTEPMLERVRTLGTVSTVAFAGGLGSIGVGVTVFIATAGKPTPGATVGSPPSAGSSLPPFTISVSGKF
ncbi:MAG: hypothetical protein R3B70_34110 [Polyangiaceae bacterium]